MLPNIKTTAALALGLAVSAAPVASAKLELNPTRPTPVPPTIVRVTAPSGGFHWRDAGIGAAGGFALSMIGIGGALVTSGRRTRHTTARQT